MIKRFALKAILIGITAAMLFKKLNGSPINEPRLSVLIGSVNVVYPDLNDVSKIPIHMHCRIIADYIHMEQFFVDCNFLKWF